jgi:hypothetical protein
MDNVNANENPIKLFGFETNDFGYFFRASLPLAVFPDGLRQLITRLYRI